MTALERSWADSERRWRAQEEAFLRHLIERERVERGAQLGEDLGSRLPE